MSDQTKPEYETFYKTRGQDSLKKAVPWKGKKDSGQGVLFQIKRNERHN